MSENQGNIEKKIREWKVELTGDHEALQRLADSSFSSDWEVTSDENSFYIVGPRLGTGSDSHVVRNVAIGAIRGIRGVFRLRHHKSPQIEIGQLTWVCEDGTSGRHVMAGPVDLPMEFGEYSTTTYDSDGNAVTRTPWDEAREWELLSTQNEMVSVVLRIAEYGEIGWVALYMIYECIRFDCDRSQQDFERAVEDNGWVPRKELKRFRHTVNDFNSTGISGRHGPRRNESPPNPMSLAKARLLIEHLVKRWIQSKLT